MLNEIPYLQSLHRPFNQELNTARWVCQCVKEYVGVINSSSELNQIFFPFLIKKLHKKYSLISKDETFPLNGLPSKSAIDNVFNHLSEIGFEYNNYRNSLVNRSTQLDRNIYSTYKASSYFVNFAKRALGLIDKNNSLTNLGNELLDLRTAVCRKSNIDLSQESEILYIVKSSLFDKTKKEKEFYFKVLLKNDFLFLIMLCYFKKFEAKYKYKKYSDLQYDFLKKNNINIFDLKLRSLRNYNTVRSTWIDDLEILDSNMKIKKRYLKLMFENYQFNQWYNNLILLLQNYEQENFKSRLKYINTKKQFLLLYDKMIKSGKHELNFVNLYDIKDEMRISDKFYMSFLADFYENERKRKDIYFSNIVNSIDRRKRFYVRGIPVLKIKIVK